MKDGEPFELLAQSNIMGCDIERLEVTLRVPNASTVREFYEPVLGCLGFVKSDQRHGLWQWVSASGRTNLVLVETAETSGSYAIQDSESAKTSRIVFAANSAQLVEKLQAVLLKLGANILVPPERYATGQHESGIIFCHDGGAILELQYRR